MGCRVGLTRAIAPLLLAFVSVSCGGAIPQSGSANLPVVEQRFFLFRNADEPRHFRFYDLTNAVLEASQEGENILRCRSLRGAPQYVIPVREITNRSALKRKTFSDPDVGVEIRFEGILVKDPYQTAFGEWPMYADGYFRKVKIVEVGKARCYPSY